MVFESIELPNITLKKIHKRFKIINGNSMSPKRKAYVKIKFKIYLFNDVNGVQFNSFDESSSVTVTNVPDFLLFTRFCLQEKIQKSLKIAKAVQIDNR